MPKNEKRRKCSVCKFHKRIQLDDDVHVKGKGCPYYQDPTLARNDESTHNRNDTQDEEIAL